jgi:hypothetical protein
MLCARRAMHRPLSADGMILIGNFLPILVRIPRDIHCEYSTIPKVPP